MKIYQRDKLDGNYLGAHILTFRFVLWKSICSKSCIFAWIWNKVLSKTHWMWSEVQMFSVLIFIVVD